MDIYVDKNNKVKYSAEELSFTEDGMLLVNNKQIIRSCLNIKGDIYTVDELPENFRANHFTYIDDEFAADEALEVILENETSINSAAEEEENEIAAQALWESEFYRLDKLMPRVVEDIITASTTLLTLPEIQQTRYNRKIELRAIGLEKGYIE